jgi:hypothetical protein
VDEVLPGVLHWQVEHPNIGMEVSSYVLTDTGTALDPLLPEGEGPEWLGHDLERVVMTVRHHVRSAPAMGVPVLAHRSGLHDLKGESMAVSGFEAGDEIAPGVRVLPFGRICPDDTALHLDLGDGVLAFGDGLVNYGELGHPPDQYLGEDPEAVKADIVEGLVPLLDEEFDALLFAHGEPVASGGKAMLRDFVDRSRAEPG